MLSSGAPFRCSGFKRRYAQSFNSCALSVGNFFLRITRKLPCTVEVHGKLFHSSSSLSSDVKLRSTFAGGRKLPHALYRAYIVCSIHLWSLIKNSFFWIRLIAELASSAFYFSNSTSIQFASLISSFLFSPVQTDVEKPFVFALLQIFPGRRVALSSFLTVFLFPGTWTAHTAIRKAQKHITNKPIQFCTIGLLYWMYKDASTDSGEEALFLLYNKSIGAFRRLV